MKPRKAVAWVCIFSPLIVGCYTSVLIDPNGEEKDRVHAEDIRYVVTTDQNRYIFDAPPAIVNDTIVGVEKIAVPYGYTTQPVSIPISAVTAICVSEYSGWRTWLAISLGVGAIALVILEATNFGAPTGPIFH